MSSTTKGFEKFSRVRGPDTYKMCFIHLYWNFFKTTKRIDYNEIWYKASSEGGSIHQLDKKVSLVKILTPKTLLFL